MTRFAHALPIADAVLYEGYVLYPYRADDPKNVVRWQFGVLMPPAAVLADPSERSALTAHLLAEGPEPAFDVRLRFLQLQRRSVERRAGDRAEEVSRLLVGDTAYLPFDEAVPQEVDVRTEPAAATARSRRHTRTVPGGTDVEEVPGGRLVRRRLPLELAVTTRTRRIEGPYGVSRLSVHVENTSRPGLAEPYRRQDALPGALVAAHLLVRVEGGRLLSMTDPPEWASGYVQESRSDGVWPVLVGPAGSADLALCSPIILPDHPEVAPESVTAFCDATEIDEMLSLRALTLTEQEKQAVRGTDPRAAGILDDVEGMPAAVMDRLHGAVRSLSAVPRRVRPDAADGYRSGRGRRPAPGRRRRAGRRDRGGQPRAAAAGGAPGGCPGHLPGRPGGHGAARPARRGRWRPPRRPARGRRGPRRRVGARPVPVLRTRRGRAAGSPAVTRPAAEPVGDTTPRTGRMLVAGVGNIFRSDDGFGSAVVAWLQQEAAGRWPETVLLRDYGIRGVHLAYDLLDGYDDVVVVDTMHRDGEPGTVYVVEPDLASLPAGGSPGRPTRPLDAHDLAPEAVLAMVPGLGGSLGRVVVVGCEPVSLADGMGLDPVVVGQVATAGRIVRDLVDATLAGAAPAAPGTTVPVRTGQDGAQ
jgi:hydrogenase maturation protease